MVEVAVFWKNANVVNRLEVRYRARLLIYFDQAVVVLEYGQHPSYDGQ
jgi:hypothetical protein